MPIKVAPEFATPGQNIKIKGSGFQEGVRAFVGGGGAYTTRITDIPNLAAYARKENYAYQFVRNEGLFVIDISNQDAPLVIGHLGNISSLGSPRDYVLKDQYIYVASGFNGLYVIDVRNPESPTLASTMKTPSDATSVEVADNFAYVYDLFGSLFVIDISNPLSLSIVSSITLPREYLGSHIELAVAGDFVYTVESALGLQIVDISNPLSPALAGAATTEGIAVNIAVKDSYAYIADHDGVEIFDISNPKLPVRIKRIDRLKNAHKVTISGNYAYVHGFDYGMYIIDISNPQSSFVVGLVPSAGKIRNSFIDDHFAYLTIFDSSEKLQIIDISHPNPPSIYTRLETADLAKVIECDTSFCYLADIQGFYIIDIQQPQSPKIISQVDFLEGSPSDIEISGNYVYVTDVSYTASSKIIDISNPYSPQIVAFRVSNDRAIAISRNFALLGNIWSGISIINVSNPNFPKVVSSIPLNYFAGNIVIHNEYAYTTTTENLIVIDITDPSTPSIVSNLKIDGWNHAIAIKEHYAIITNDAGFQVVDISNPTLPVESANIKITMQAKDIAIAGSLAYIADANGGLLVVDIDQPKSPKVIGHIDTASRVYGVTVKDERVYTADDYLGFAILPAVEPAKVNSIEAMNLDINVPEHLMPGPYTISVFNPDGLVYKKHNAVSVLNIAHFDLLTGTLTLPVVEVEGLGRYAANLQHVENEAKSIEFILENAESTSSILLEPSTFSFSHNLMHIPQVNVLNNRNHVGLFQADLLLTMGLVPMKFTLINAEELNSD